MAKFLKDRWIKDALAKRYLIALEDGRIFRCRKADKDGNLLSSEYSEVKQQVHKATGRVFFNMTWRGYTKAVLVNRVIALRFLPNPKNLPQVNHVDGDKQHNYLRQPTEALHQKWGEFQLEWSSGSDNEKHAHRTGLKTGRGSSNSNAKLTAADVAAIRASHGAKAPDARWQGVAETAVQYGVSRSTIINVLNQRTWRHL